MTVSSPNFSARIRTALADHALGDNLAGAMQFLRTKRQSVFSDAERFAALRLRGEAIRSRAIDKLPDLLEQLESRCTANGMQVHWALDAAEAKRIVLRLLDEAGARRVVKGKSMLSEEIGLNHALAEAGIECLETDMGEYIVQLAGETPSHIIMPAIHKTKEDVAVLFHEAIPNTPYTDDVDTLIGIGREVLRKKFEEADVGISGVNFAIAETGTLCLVENEGNGRLCTTLPRQHIALMGIEKVIEKLDDLPPLLELLTGSATGQTITTYVNLISSPRQAEDRDGPAQVHLVLVDNGRSQMFADPELRQTLRCIRCGACMNHCPVYTRIGGHAYGTVYPGPIGQVVAPQLEGLDKHGELLDACSLNGACGEVCPVGIPLPDLVRRLRSDAKSAAAPTLGAGAHQGGPEHVIWRLWLAVHRRPALYRFVTRWVTRLRHVLPRWLGPWTRHRAYPTPAKRTLHERLQSRGGRHE